MNTLNVYGVSREDYGYQTKPLWLRIDHRQVAGGTVAVSPGDYIPAGTPMIIQGKIAGGTAVKYNAGDTLDPLNDAIGLVWNDVYVDPTTVNPTATVALVLAGEIREDLLLPEVTEVDDAFKEATPLIIYIKERTA